MTDGLAALVQESFGLDPFSQCLFAFYNRQRNKLKILSWEHNGFWLFYCRFEGGTFQWPVSSDSTVSITSRELRSLLNGLSLTYRQARRKVTVETVIFGCIG
ncbi:IS66 family insertion sequence element accessory protein TnpB [Paenibacillus sp. KR2-11]|uniref:IS66 family insertion sequence element accessory protein TnpB n=1 Tax=Paenibacillus sp. KR2-11 TaxID=3385500 RepID=UPI0038FCCF8C